MSPSGQPVACERVRAQVSLELDGELSQLERALLAAHLIRCPACREYCQEVHDFTGALRAAPLERGPAVAVRRYRRPAVRLQAGIAAVMAFAAVGLGTQAVQSRDDASSLSIRVNQFQSQNDLEREQAMIQVGSSGSGSRSSGEATVR